MSLLPIKLSRLTDARCCFVIAGALAASAAFAADPVPQIAPYGSWASPVSAEASAKGRVALGDLRGANQKLYWTESLPSAGGKTAVFGMGADGVAAALTPEGSNVRTRVHEYGGAPFVVAGDSVYYSEFTDQRLYRLKAGSNPVPVTPAGYRYADCSVMTAKHGAHSLLCVREDHTDKSTVRNAVVRLPLPQGGAGDVLFADSDFVAYPRVSPDGRSLAFIAWNHPHMPWDGTELKIAKFSARGLETPITVAGSTQESVLEPQWDTDGKLYFISDRSGFWNLYSWSDGRARPVWPKAAEVGGPLWSFGQANYVLLGDGRAVVRFGEKGFDRLAVVNLKNDSARILELPFVAYSHLTPIDSEHIAAMVASATLPRAIVRIDLKNSSAQSLRSAGSALLPPAAVSVAVPIDFPSANGRTAHAFYFPPLNPAYQAPKDSLPPLVTFVHGGPTAQTEPAYSPTIQYWTSRGFGAVDVNYGGSTGFGRAYRRELNGNWGVVDVEDVIAAARYLGSTGRVDSARMAISGGSAGGYTVLVALSTSDVFKAGADYYGVSDMTALAKDTHKFESRYLDSMIGPLPDAQAVYDSRSPLNHLDGFKAPLIVFQGADDPVVPPNQSAKIVEALRARQVPVAYLLYPGEGHGFRKPENIIRSLQSELSFYGQVFGFTPAGDLPPLTIENLKPKS
jgi:dipeptidyl aminopeptidase/acylaminoacyl peptidase